MNRIILYFNLPFKEYRKPTKIFPSSNYDSEFKIKSLLEAFEKQGLRKQQPNVVLMQAGKKIIGGYATHGWSISESERGTDECFLFNIDQNF